MGQLALGAQKMFSSQMPWDFWLIFLFLGVLLPWRGYRRLKRLLALPSVSTKEKIALYAVTIAFQWALVAIVGWRCLAHGLGDVSLGVAVQEASSSKIWLVSLLGGALVGCLQWFNLRRVARMQGAAPEFMKTLASRILPKQSVERIPYYALAITAGVCEEFVYRGFVMAALWQAGLATWVVVVLSSILFGLAHAYQGVGGIIATGGLGVVFALVRIAWGSLVPVMVFHSVVDLVAGIAGPKYLLRVE
jgi:uncharacterized protein